MIKRKIPTLVLMAVFVISGCIFSCFTPQLQSGELVTASKKDRVGLDFSVDPLDEKYSELSVKSFGWGFKKEKGAPPEIALQTVDLLNKTNTYYIDKREGKKLYLTFDEGYENGFTSKILDVLKEKNIPAAFFITGPYLERETELVDRMVNEGHIVGNHTVNHPNLAKSDLQTVKSELQGLEQAFFERYGKSMMYMRPPEGECSEKMLSFAADMGYKTILWSFAYKDWDVKVQRGGRYAFEQVTPYLHDGCIMLLHAVSSDNAEALGSIIDYAISQGYEFVSLDNLE